LVNAAGIAATFTASAQTDNASSFLNLRRLYWEVPAQAGYGDKRTS
jgi:hypothetical protein